MPAPEFLVGALATLAVYSFTHQVLHDRNAWTLLGLLAAFSLWPGSVAPSGYAMDRPRTQRDVAMTGRWLPAPPAVLEPGWLPARPPRNRIKVLHVITRLEAGAGGNTLVSALGMDPQRYDVWIAAGGNGPLWESAERAGIRTVRIPEFRREVSPARDAAVLVRLVRLIRAERFAIVHVHEAKAGFLGRLAATRAAHR